MSTPNPARDPDGLFQAAEALRPDAVTMFARSMLGSGVLGSLLDRIDRILEAREEREMANPGPARSVSEKASARSAPITEHEAVR